jgi:ABC-type bacteriocin/lantibiotic exporter with double-glycine peptidase domain
MNLTFLAQLHVSFRRIEQYLQSPEYKPRSILPDSSPNAIVVKDASFRWGTLSRSDVVLADISLVAKRHELTAIVGAVASGKSSLIHGCVLTVHHATYVAAL